VAQEDLAARVRELEAQVSALARARADEGDGPILKALLDDMAKRHAVENQLLQAHEWLRLAQEAGKVAAYTFLFSTGRLEWSPSTAALYGFEPGTEPTLDRWLAAIHPDDRDRVQQVADAALQHGADVDHRFRLVRADGSCLWVQDRGRIILGDDGRPERLVGINVDITELVELEQQAVADRERLRLAMKAKQIACWEWDPASGAVQWDDNLAAMAGLAADFGDSVDGFFTLVHAEDQPRVRQALDDALAGKCDYDIEFRMVRPDGRLRWTHTRGVVVRDQQGRPLRMVGVDADITDQKAQQAALRENDRFLQSVLDASTDCIKVIELDGSVSYMNRNGQYVMEVSDVTRLLGRQWDTLWPEPGASLVRQSLEQARKGRHSNFEALCPTAAGTPKYWDVSVAPIRGEDGTPVRIVSISRDISARQAAHDQLQLYNAELHHRIKNNLATVQAMARATLRHAPDLQQFEQHFFDRLTAMASTYGLLGVGEDAASLSVLAANELKPYNNGVQQIRLDGPEVVLPATRAVAVGMMLHELTTNACKYGSLCRPGGQLDVRWTVETREGDERLLRLEWVERGGPSIAPPTRFGFGSTLIDRLVRQHRGTIDRTWAENGLRLQLTLPLG